MFLYRVALRTLPVLAVALAATANAATPSKPAARTVAPAAAKPAARTNIAAASKPASHPAASAQDVKIENFTFKDKEITVKVGTTVRWVNEDDIPHNIVAKDMSFKSKVLDTGDEFSYTFTKPGVFDYFCGLHPHMTGRVTVTG